MTNTKEKSSFSLGINEPQNFTYAVMMKVKAIRFLHVECEWDLEHYLFTFCVNKYCKLFKSYLNYFKLKYLNLLNHLNIYI